MKKNLIPFFLVLFTFTLILAAPTAASAFSVTVNQTEVPYSSATGYAAHAEGDTTSAKGRAAHSEGSYTSANGNFSHAAGERAVVNSADHRAFAWQGAATTTNEFYRSHGPGTFNLNPEGGADGVFIGEESLRALVRRLVAEELAAQGD